LCDFHSGFAARCEARLSLAVESLNGSLGYAPGPAFGLETLGLSPNRGHSPLLKKTAARQGRALPHIGRRSRSESSRTSFVAVVGLIDFQDGISQRAAKPQ